MTDFHLASVIRYGVDLDYNIKYPVLEKPMAHTTKILKNIILLRSLSWTYNLIPL